MAEEGGKRRYVRLGFEDNTGLHLGGKAADLPELPSRATEDGQAVGTVPLELRLDKMPDLVKVVPQ